jgi:hypothetical protein
LGSNDRRYRYDHIGEYDDSSDGDGSSYSMEKNDGVILEEVD